MLWTTGTKLGSTEDSGDSVSDQIERAAGEQLEKGPVSSREAALLAARAADAKKATDIVVQDVSELVGSTDYFVIVTAANSRQVSAIVDAIEEAMRKRTGEHPLHREETRDGSWELLDYGYMVAHVFQPETREFYRLEALWNDAPVIDLAAEGFSGIEYSDRIAELLKKRAAEDASGEVARFDGE